VRPHQYGATFAVSERYAVLQREFPKTIRKHERAITFVGRELSRRGVGHLEPLATALFLTKEHPSMSVHDRARELG
jgi:hypothetical protein